MENEFGYVELQVKRDGPVDWLTLNRPERLNAFNATMIAELNDYFLQLAVDETVRVVVLRGAGKGFCAGVDVKEITGLVANGIVSDMRGQRRISEVVMRMRRCPQPIIALMHGAATGGGFALALAADVRIAADTARMNCAFIKLGLTACDMGLSYMLPRMVGVSVASELMMTGRFIDAKRAVALGLVSEAVAEKDLEKVGRGYVDDMLATSPLGLKLTKEGLNMALDAPSLEAAIALEDRNQVLTIQSPNFTEGMRAFLQKRPPKYQDR